MVERCDAEEFIPGPNAEMIFTNSYKCKSSFDKITLCEYIKNTVKCKKQIKKYHSNVSEFNIDRLLSSCENLNFKREKVKYQSALNLLKFLSNQSDIVFTLNDISNLDKFWIELNSFVTSIKSEFYDRDIYNKECVCIGDKNHQKWIGLLSNILEQYDKIIETIDKFIKTNFDIPSESYLGFNYYIVSNVQAVYSDIYKQNYDAICSYIVDNCRYLESPVYFDISGKLKNQIDNKLKNKFGNLLNFKVLNKCLKKVFYDSIRPLILDSATYLNLQCFEIENDIVKNFNIDFYKLSEYIGKAINIYYEPTGLKVFIIEKFSNELYSTCFQTIRDHDKKLFEKLCQNAHLIENKEIKEILHKFCVSTVNKQLNPDILSNAQMNNETIYTYIQNSIPSRQLNFSYKQILQKRPYDEIFIGDYKPTGNFLQDLYYMKPGFVASFFQHLQNVLDEYEEIARNNEK